MTKHWHNEEYTGCCSVSYKRLYLLRLGSEDGLTKTVKSFYWSCKGASLN